MHLQLLALIIVANAAPILLARLTGDNANWPVDFGLMLGRHRLLGPSKTWRGILGSLLLTSACADLLGLEMSLGLLVAAAAMAGDLLASFIKRRMGIEASGMAPLLDQVPESLLPALLLMRPLQLGWDDVVILVLMFIVIELLLSRLGYILRLRKRPY